MTEESKKSDLGPQPWGSEPIRGVDYNYLDIVKPVEKTPEPVMPESREFSAVQAQDFYQRTRSKIVKWASGAGVGKEVTNYILLIPDIMALMVRLMADPRVSAQLKVEIGAASAYIISPVDLMPEAVLGPAGLIDDVIVGMIALNRVLKAMGDAGRDVLVEYWDGDDDLLKKMEEVLDQAENFVTGTVWKGIKKFMENAASEASTAVQNFSEQLASPQRSGNTSPIIEGSSRPILPPNEQPKD